MQGNSLFFPFHIFTTRNIKKKDGLLLFFIHFPNAFKFYLKVYEFAFCFFLERSSFKDRLKKNRGCLSSDSASILKQIFFFLNDVCNVCA